MPQNLVLDFISGIMCCMIFIDFLCGDVFPFELKGTSTSFSYLFFRTLTNENIIKVLMTLLCLQVFLVFLLDKNNKLSATA